jgi:hypothetical protein
MVAWPPIGVFPVQPFRFAAEAKRAVFAGRIFPRIRGGAKKVNLRTICIFSQKLLYYSLLFSLLFS